MSHLPPPTLSIVSHGHGAMVLDLLRDIQAAVSPVGEVILTLNLADEDTRPFEAFAAQTPWPLRIVQNILPKGYGENHNQAFAAKNLSDPNAAFVVLNPDLRWQTDPLAPLMAALLQPKVGVAAPKVLGVDGQVEDSWRDTLTPWRLFKRYAFGQRQISANPTWAAGMCLAFNPRAYLAAGGFDEAYFMYCEDMDLGLRLRKLGWQTAFVGSASVTHAAQRASRKNRQHLLWHVQSLLRFWWRLALGRV